CFHVLIPLFQNFFPKLRAHLLPRIQEVLQREAASTPEHSGFGTTYNAERTVTLNFDHDACNLVFLKKDRITTTSVDFTLRLTMCGVAQISSTQVLLVA